MQASPTTARLWGWGGWCVYATSYCNTSGWLKIAASIAMATGAASLSYEGDSLDASAAMVDAKERGNSWCNRSSFSHLSLGDGMDRKETEKALVVLPWGRG